MCGVWGLRCSGLFDRPKRIGSSAQKSNDARWARGRRCRYRRVEHRVHRNDLGLKDHVYFGLWDVSRIISRAG